MLVVNNQRWSFQLCISKDEQSTTILGYRRQLNDCTEDNEMGKRDIKGTEDTRVLFKQSNHKLIQSRTCSETSEFYTKCGLLQFKNKLSQRQNKNKNVIKRDLSIETDICILRRYCKKKINKSLTKDSGKSKYSTIFGTEIGTIEKFESSACGDSEKTDLTNNILLDTTRIMMDNLEDLLNDWIIRHLLANGDTKSKLECTLYSLLNRDENDETGQSSSRHTYVLSKNNITRDVKDKKVATSLSYCKSGLRRKKIGKPYKNKYGKGSSCHFSPGSHRGRRIISTLSIPRNIHKHEIKNFKPVTTERRNLLLSIKKSSQRLDASSYDFLSISTKSFTKRCATYESEHKRKKQKKKRRIVFLPHASYKSTTVSTFDFGDDVTTIMKDKIIKEDDNLEALPSLVKSLYVDDPAYITSSEKFKNITDNCTMTDFNISQRNFSVLEPNNGPYTKNQICETLDFQPFTNHFAGLNQNHSMLTIDSVNQSSPLNNLKSLTSNNCMTTKPINNQNVQDLKTRKCCCTKHIPKHRTRVTKARNYSKRFTCFNDLTKRNKCVMQKTDDSKNTTQQYGDCFQNICKHFIEYEEKNKNIKLNVEVKFVPTVNVKQEDKFTAINPNVISFGAGKSKTVVCNLATITDLPYEAEKNLNTTAESFTSQNNRVIIPLLDGAASQEKYIIKSNISTVKSDDLNLSCVQRDRGTITDDGITKNIHELKAIIMDFTKAAESFAKRHMTNQSTAYVSTDNGDNHPKSVQNTCIHPLISGIKLSKTPKNASEFYDRIMQKSNSYNVIDSESIIRVTDMTSAVNYSTKPLLNSILKSKSQMAIASDQRNKFCAYYCDECKHDFNVQSSSETSFPSRGVSNLRSWNRMYTEPAPTYMPFYLSSKKHSYCDDIEKVALELCRSSCGGLCDQACKSCQKMVDYDCPSSRKGIGFLEGFVYCLLLWIPVIVLFLVFYQVILKHKIDYVIPKAPKAIGLVTHNNGTPYHVQLSDLGF